MMVKVFKLLGQDLYLLKRSARGLLDENEAQLIGHACG